MAHAEIIDPLLSIAATLAPARVSGISEINKGGNSRIWHVETSVGAFALKRYPAPSAHDPRSRQQNEAAALNFMHAHGIENVPRVVAIDAQNSYTLLSWCAGEPVSHFTRKQLSECAAFLARLANLSTAEGAEALPDASEACLSLPLILSHIEKRLSKLKPIPHPELSLFINSELLPALAEKTAAARAAIKDVDGPLPRARQVLIPSDFGAHNALLGAGGLLFLDFEYFGWDSPATSAANFIFHPAMALNAEEREHFLHAIEPAYTAQDADYPARLRALAPLYAIRWCCIILGEFIPEHWAHRVANGVYKEADKNRVQSAQLQKAKALLASVL